MYSTHQNPRHKAQYLNKNSSFTRRMKRIFVYFEHNDVLRYFYISELQLYSFYYSKRTACFYSSKLFRRLEFCGQ